MVVWTGDCVIIDSSGTGQGILAETKVLLKWIRNEIKKGLIKDAFEYTSHDGCGAARIVCDQLKKGKLSVDFITDQSEI